LGRNETESARVDPIVSLIEKDVILQIQRARFLVLDFS
jgi:hypothetical protein